MTTSLQSDAEVLWSDVCDAMRNRGSAPHIIAMLESCTPQDLSAEALTVSTSRFAKRQIQNNIAPIEECLQNAAFMPLKLVITDPDVAAQKIETKSEVSPDELRQLLAQEAIAQAQAQSPVQIQPEVPSIPQTAYPAPACIPSMQVPEQRPLTAQERRARNDLIEDITESDSKLTFDRFVEGEENILAFQAAKQVADGENKNYNPLFIYGKSGLGKTHLLKAIQNYIVKNDPERLCIYRTAKDFQNDYVAASNDKYFSAKEALRQNYRDIDVLIIDDIQYLSGQATIAFFFDTFNYLSDHGKQIVLAADRSPMQLGIGDKGLDERVTSRIGSGVTITIQVPSYELKLALIKNFYDRMKADAQRENTHGYTGTISEENLELMAERSGSNIRNISGFCSDCLLMSTKKESSGEHLEREDIISLARSRWNPKQAIITIEAIQKVVEDQYGVSHANLVGNKRQKDIMEARHVAIWLTRQLTDNTLADIGNKFGGRTHATVLNSIHWVEDASKENRIFFDQVSRIKESLVNDS